MNNNQSPQENVKGIVIQVVSRPVNFSAKCKDNTAEMAAEYNECHLSVPELLRRLDSCITYILKHNDVTPAFKDSLEYAQRECQGWDLYDCTIEK